jgi:hypothetical protein
MVGTSVITVETANSTYEIYEDMMVVRRTPVVGMPMREDGKAVTLLRMPEITVGKPMRMWLDGVAEFGETVRTTSPVISFSRN